MRAVDIARGDVVGHPGAIAAWLVGDKQVSPHASSCSLLIWRPELADSIEVVDRPDRTWAKAIGLWLGPLSFAAILFGEPVALAAGGNQVLASACWMLCWWITEAVPLAVTALLPIVLFSLTGAMRLEDALQPYSNRIIYLFFGGFVLAIGLEEHRLHQRIALWIIRLVGVRPHQLILGFLLATAALSMWISNTATAVMMLPMALSLLLLIYPEGTDYSRLPGVQRRFTTSLILAVAYGANIGGMATVIGTPPNLVMRGYFADALQVEVSFFQWLACALPIVLVLLATVYWLLVYCLFPCRHLSIDAAAELFEREQQRLGAWTSGQRRMLAVFVGTALMWVFRDVLQSLHPAVPLSDEVIGVSAAIALFVIPDGQGRPLLTWEATRRLPWGILLLFGGGLCLAKGLEGTGIIAALSDAVHRFGGGQVWLTLILLTAMALFLTELMSNVALIAVLVPVICGIAQGLGVPPIYFAFPVTLASSCAFMLPMATPPNAIVFATGRLTVWDMATAGFWLNLVSLVIILLLSQPLIWCFEP